MTVELEASALRLGAGQTLRVRDAAGETICCREGSVWITEERNPRDVILGPGACYRLKNRGLALVYAFRDTALAFA